MSDVGRPQPVVGLVPSHPRLVTKRHVLDVKELFVLSLLAPDLAAHVAGIGQDGAHGALGPGDAAPVRVALPVTSCGRRGAFGGELLRDREHSGTSQILVEDPFDDRCRFRVQLQLVESFAVGGFRGVGVWSGVRQAVAIGRSTAEEATFDLSLGAHGRSNADLDPVAFALGHAAEHAHDQVVRLGRGIDGPADFGDPEANPIVLEDGECEAVLVAVEGPLWLADDHSIKPAMGVLEGFEQAGGLRSAFPR
nr:hypothetical protein [Allosaccharopolyspora coralli]